MKKMKKFLALAMATAMVLSTAVTASAATNFAGKDTPASSTADVTITNVAEETTGMTAISAIKATDNGKGVVTYELEDWVKTALASETKYQILDDQNSIIGWKVDEVIKDLGGKVATGAETGQNTPETDIPTNEKNALVAKLSKAWSDIAADKKPSVQKYTATGLASPGPASAKQTATFTAVKVGYYIIEVSDSVNVYNPMAVAVGLVANKPVDSSNPTKGTTGEYTAVYAQNSVAKYTQVTIDKKQTNSDDVTDKTGDYQVGDPVTYEIDTKIPDYDLSRYTDPTFYITDTVTDGLDLIKEIEVTVGDPDDKNNTMKEVKYTRPATTAAAIPGVTVTWDEKNRAFKLDFSAALKDKTTSDKYLGKDVHIEYTTTVNKQAATGFDPNTNKATVDFDRTPNAKDGHKEKETYVYTFSIDGSILANEVSKGWEFKKTGQDKWDKVKDWEITSDNYALAGAEFELYKKVAKGTTGAVLLYGTDADNTAVYAVMVDPANLKGTNPNPTLSQNDGRITFEGLDGSQPSADPAKQVIYYLKESKAPDGYSLNTEIYSVEFRATEFDSNDKLKKYEVWIGTSTTTATCHGKYTYNENATAGTAKVTYESTGLKTHEEGGKLIKDGTEEIKNTKLASLPSTGGIGTTIFTVAGILIMVFAAAMFFATKKKRA